eukprot:8289254-Heterocapsa_arctica.AAC.1
MVKNKSTSLAKLRTGSNGEELDKSPFSRIGNVRVDIHSFGNLVQTYDFDNGDEDNKNYISVLWCNIQKWGAHTNHY